MILVMVSATWTYAGWFERGNFNDEAVGVIGEVIKKEVFIRCK